jgi:hypothetical protein
VFTFDGGASVMGLFSMTYFRFPAVMEGHCRQKYSIGYTISHDGVSVNPISPTTQGLISHVANERNGVRATVHNICHLIKFNMSSDVTL